MVATMNNEFFEKSKDHFENGEIVNSIESYEKAISYIDPSKKASYLQFLNQLLHHCKENNLLEEEAVVLRSLGRTYSFFKQYVESLRFHEESLKIQRQLGKKLDVADGLLFLAEDLEVSGNYEHCIKSFEDAAQLFHELGKPKKTKEIEKEIKRLKKFSKDIVEDEYYLNRFHIDKF